MRMRRPDGEIEVSTNIICVWYCEVFLANLCLLKRFRVCVLWFQTKSCVCFSIFCIWLSSFVVVFILFIVYVYMYFKIGIKTVKRFCYDIYFYDMPI